MYMCVCLSQCCWCSYYNSCNVFVPLFNAASIPLNPVQETNATPPPLPPRGTATYSVLCWYSSCMYTQYLHTMPPTHGQLLTLYLWWPAHDGKMYVYRMSHWGLSLQRAYFQMWIDVMNHTTMHVQYTYIRMWSSHNLVQTCCAVTRTPGTTPVPLVKQRSQSSTQAEATYVDTHSPGSLNGQQHPGGAATPRHTPRTSVCSLGKLEDAEWYWGNITRCVVVHWCVREENGY